MFLLKYAGSSVGEAGLPTALVQHAGGLADLSHYLYARAF